jgi:hypothetical protein
MSSETFVSGKDDCTASSLEQPLLFHGNEDNIKDLEGQLPPFNGSSFSRTCLNLTNAVSGSSSLCLSVSLSLSRVKSYFLHFAME